MTPREHKSQRDAVAASLGEHQREVYAARQRARNLPHYLPLDAIQRDVLLRTLSRVIDRDNSISSGERDVLRELRGSIQFPGEAA